MYNPSHFRVEDRKDILGLIREYGFGMVFGSNGGQDFASHVPMVIDDSGKAIRGHFAAENSMSGSMDGKRVLVVFQGPSHYISPVWYGKDHMVPTWNYVTVHATGTLKIFKQTDAKVRVLDEIADYYEARIGGSWKADWSDRVFLKMLDHIVAFEIAVDKLEGKWKLSQNHPVENVMGVAKRLREIGTPEAHAMADLMENSKK